MCDTVSKLRAVAWLMTDRTSCEHEAVVRMKLWVRLILLGRGSSSGSPLPLLHVAGPSFLERREARSIVFASTVPSVSFVRTLL